MAGVLLGIALLSGCSATRRNRGNAPAAAGGQAPLIASTDRLLVLPLRDGSCLPVYGNHVTCHLTGEHLDAGVVPRGTGAELAVALFQHLRRLQVPLIPFQRGIQLMSEIGPAAVDRYEPSLAEEIGKRAGASKTVMGVVARYDERSGSWFGSRESAAVAFSLALVDVATGVVTHKLRFNRRQAPLTTNLFAVKTWWEEGFRWWTRKEIAARALAEAAEVLAGTGKAPPLWTNLPLRPPPHEFGEWQVKPSPRW